MLKQSPAGCGRFHEEFSTERLLEISSDLIDEADGIIPSRERRNSPGRR